MIERENTIDTLLDLEADELVELPYGNFAKVASQILETACLMIQASRGLLVLLDGDNQFQIQATYALEKSPQIKDALLPFANLSLEGVEDIYISDSSSSHPPSLPGASSYICAFLQKRSRQARPGMERRKYEYRSEQREFFFKEFNRTFGFLYLDRREKEKSFSAREKVLIENYLPLATHQLLQARIYEVSTLDATTHFFSRSQLDRLLDIEIQGAKKGAYPIGVAIFSLREKGEGHLLDDLESREKLWKELANLIRHYIRDEDHPIRLDSNRGLLICPCAGERGMEILGQRLKKEISARKFGTSKIEIDLQIGAVVYPVHSEDQEILIKRCEQALRLSERTKGDFVLWSPHAEKLLDIITGDLSKDYRNVMMLLDTIIALNSTLDYRQLLSIIVDMMLELTQGDRCLLITYPTRGEPEILAQDRQGKPLKPENYPKEIIERVRQGETPFTEEDAQRDPQLAKKLKELEIKRVLAVSLPVREKVLGVIYVDSKNQSREFSEQDRVFFYALTHQIALALENSRLYQENLEAKKRVEELNLRLREKFKKKEEELEEVRDTLNINLQELEKKYTYSNIIGKSKALQDIFETMDKIADTEVPVVITGESGTGKELIARAIHFNSSRKDKPFVSINCAALPDSLLESELFGYKKGAFTGANSNKKGLFEMAHRGTLFLDEVGDMSLEMQKKLLRVLEEEEIRPIGGRKTIPVNARIIAATNQDLHKMMETGEFREDLFYRLNVMHIKLPPLRERKEDIPLLAEKFLCDYAEERGREVKTLAPGAIRKIVNYDWPGNIRELKNFMERTAIICSSREITEKEIVLEGRQTQSSEIPYPAMEKTKNLLDDTLQEIKDYFSDEYLPQVIKEALAAINQDRWEKLSGVEELFSLPFKKAKKKFVKIYLQHLLEEHNYNISQAAKKADLLRTYLHKLLKKHNIDT